MEKPEISIVVPLFSKRLDFYIGIYLLVMCFVSAWLLFDLRLYMNMPPIINQCQVSQRLVGNQKYIL